MSVLNGGLVRAKHITTDVEFVDEFCDSISREEWATIGQFAQLTGRGVTRVTELVSLVGEIRSAPTYPLPPHHPLNPASRYTTPTVAIGEA